MVTGGGDSDAPRQRAGHGERPWLPSACRVSPHLPSLQGPSPECASQVLPCGHSSSSPRTPPPCPCPLLTPRSSRREPGGWECRGEAGASPGSGRDAGREGCSRKEAGWEGCSAEQRPSGASRCRPPSPINYSRVAPNRFHLKSGKAGGRRKAVPDKGGRFDTH